MNDTLSEYMKKNAPQIPPAPADEWSQILRRTQQPPRRGIWLGVSALTLSAAAWLAFIRLSPPGQDFESLRVDDIFYRDRVEVLEPGAYSDWLWLADAVDAGGD